MTQTDTWVFRLQGERAGKPFVVDLAPGDCSVGSAPDNTIVLVDSAVSRRHATLRVEGSSVLVRDMGSKNGTYINGRRVTEGRLEPNDIVSFGPVQLILKRIDPADAQLAISLGGETVAIQELLERPSTETVRVSQEHRPGSWLATLSALADNLLGERDVAVFEALTALGEGLSLRAAVFLRWAGAGEASVSAMWGDGIDIERCDQFRSTTVRAADAAQVAPVLLTGRDTGPPPLVWAVLARPGETPWGLVLGGEFPYWEQAEPLTEVVLRMLVHAQPEAIHLSLNGAAKQPPTLVFPEGHVVGRSPAMKTLYEELKLLVVGDLPVLIEGETGVGKEHIARALHLSSTRTANPFVAVNCAAIPAELLEAELFGIERGVATGVAAREGKFRQADGGVLVLDEIGEMPLSLQPKLLRALQQGEISPLGGRAPVQVDVRVIAMTNSDLWGRVKEGKFRNDLYFRLNGYRLRVPPLRDRRADIPLLVEYFLRKFTREVGKPVRGLTLKALRALVQAQWEGNVRELEHEVRRLVYLCPWGETIDSSLLSPEILYPSPDMQVRQSDTGADLHLERHVETLERRLITIALARAKNNRSKAAKLLGISRNGLALKLARLGM